MDLEGLLGYYHIGRGQQSLSDRVGHPRAQHQTGESWLGLRLRNATRIQWEPRKGLVTGATSPFQQQIQFIPSLLGRGSSIQKINGKWMEKASWFYLVLLYHVTKYDIICVIKYYTAFKKDKVSNLCALKFMTVHNILWLKKEICRTMWFWKI